MLEITELRESITAGKRVHQVVINGVHVIAVATDVYAKLVQLLTGDMQISAEGAGGFSTPDMAGGAQVVSAREEPSPDLPAPEAELSQTVDGGLEPPEL